MTYIHFTKKELINLNFSLKREFLRSNRAGSFASTTVPFCNTRKYHGLLICPLDNLDGQNHVLLSALDDTIIQDNKEFHIGSRRYPGEHHPLGHKYIEDFFADPIPSHIYRVGDITLKKEILLAQNEERILIRYTLVDAQKATKLRLQPYLAFRQIHKLSKANMDANTKYESVANGIKVKLYNGYPYLYMQTNKTSEYIHAPNWYYNIEYQEERDRGYDFHEDLMAIGFIEIPIKKGESIVFSAGTSEIEPSTLKRRFTTEIKKRVPRDSFENNLENSAQQFFIKKDNKLFINAGYPWFDIWARDTFISLPGLALSRGDLASAKKVLNTMSKELKNGLFPNAGIGKNVDANSVDAPLWYIWTIQKYVEKLGSFAGIWKSYGSYITQILETYKKGTIYGIKMKDKGLIYAGVKGKALTWMDAIVDGKPVTPRIGFDVEINALWYNAICFAIEVAKKARNNKFVEKWEHLPELIKESFLETFWDKDKAYLADYVNEEEKNMDVRPNQLIAASLPYTMLNDDQINSVLKICENELLTPKGLRSLSPKNAKYKGRYEGNQKQRDKAYHQGTVWPWLSSFFAEAYLRIHMKSGLRFVEKMYHNFEEDMFVAGLGTISEIYDGDPPHTPKGAISQAWSVAAVLYIHELIEKYKKD